MSDFYKESDLMKFENNEIVYQTIDYATMLTKPHFHDAIEIIYVLEGKFEVIVSDIKYTLTPGEMVIINAKETHAVITPEQGMNRSVAIKFLPETICSENQSLSELKYAIPYIISFSNFKTYYPKEFVENSKIKYCIESIMREDKERDPAYHFAIRIYISVIVLELYRKHNNINPVLDDIRDDIRVKFSRIFQYIAEHYSEKIVVADICRQFNIRPAVFSDCLKKLTGKNFNEYLNYIRLCKAKRMLIDSDKNIEEIAYEVGFSSPSYFGKCFKMQMNTTPMNFRLKYADPATAVYENYKSNLG